MRAPMTFAELLAFVMYPLLTYIVGLAAGAWIERDARDRWHDTRDAKSARDKR